MLDDVKGRSHTAPVDNCLGGSDTASVTSKNPSGSNTRRSASNSLYQPYARSVSDDESSVHGSVHTQLLEPPSSSSMQPGQECLKDSVRRIRRLVQQSPRKGNHTTARRGETFPPPKPATATGSSSSGYVSKFSSHRRPTSSLDSAFAHQPRRLRSEEPEPTWGVRTTQIPPVPAQPAAQPTQPAEQPQLAQPQAPAQPALSAPHTPPSTNHNTLRRGWESKVRHFETQSQSRLEPPASSQSASPRSNSNFKSTPPLQPSMPPFPPAPPREQVNDSVQERVKNVTMTIAREAAREASRGAGSDALSRESGSALPSKSELIERMIAYSRSNQRPPNRGDSSTSQSIHTNLSQPRLDINVLAPSPIINDAPAVAPPRRGLSSNIIGAKAAAMRQVFSQTAPIARPLNNNISNESIPGGSDARASSSQQQNLPQFRPHTSVLKTNQTSTTRPHGTDSLYNTPGDSQSTSTQPPPSSEPRPHAMASQTQQQLGSTAAATALAATPDQSAESTASPGTSQKSQEPWKELQWRQFSIAMRDSLAHQNLNFSCAVSLLTEMRARLPADLKDMTLDEVVRRLVVWVNRTESLQKQ